MPAMKIEAASGVHPYGTLAELSALLADGQKPFEQRGMETCSAAAFATVKALGPSLRRTPRLARLALAAALQLPHFSAENAAGDGDQWAVVVATAFGSVASTFDFMDSLLADGPDMASPTAFSHSVTNMTAAMLGQHLRLTGPAMTVTDAEGDAFAAALSVASGMLETGSAEKVFLFAVDESNAAMDAILAAHSAVPPGMEGAAAFALSRGDRETCPHIHVAPPENAPGQDAAPTTGIHGPGTLALAWNAALTAISPQLGSTPLRCRDDHGAGRKRDVWISMGTTP